MAKNPLQRKTVEIDRKRIPLRQLLHGKEIRDAAKSLEEFRLKLNEKEFLYGAKISIQWDTYGDVYAVARRPETDNEYNDRVERARIAAEQKAERDRKRKLAAEQRAIREKELQKERALQTLKDMAKSNGLTAKDLQALLEG